ncbi:MAG: hypothetical protein WD823_04070 [Sulfuricaulis sp.]|jgi:uncharacterized membrane protein YeaQ/YmgE (transglycosylase-associated protein family)|uniref:DUF1269 domain-containing protein n=1 Tax=Sulfuricaulis sp. TaxID=2003553 RepID=UPI002C26A95D|nr:hypothetical protein [Sulfuricaulis sp.]
MRRRLYFLLPNVKHAKQVYHQLLLSHIEERYIHALAREGITLGDLPEATVMEKSDARHGLGLGLIVGGLTGALAGVVALMFPPSGLAMNLSVILAMSVIGAIMGLWISGMIASDVPNTHLKEFTKEIENGKILLIVDVPKEQVQTVTRKVKKLHPEADMRGRDPTIPAFP